MKDDKLYLIHLSECIQRIESYTQEGRDGFLKSRMTQDAIVRNFEVMWVKPPNKCRKSSNKHTPKFLESESPGFGISSF